MESKPIVKALSGDLSFWSRSCLSWDYSLDSKKANGGIKEESKEH
jgi:hypothetical protein